MIHIQPYMDMLYHFMIHISELYAINAQFQLPLPQTYIFAVVLN